MQGLYEMKLDCGKLGELDGLFLADCDKINYLTTHEISVNFGKVLGQYSEISGTISKDEINLITTDENVIKIIKDYDLENGYNPLIASLSIYETNDWPEETHTEEDFEAWDECTVEEFIDFRMTGKLPEEF